MIVEKRNKRTGNVDCWGRYEYEDEYVVIDDNGKEVYRSENDPTKLINAVECSVRAELTNEEAELKRLKRVINALPEDGKVMIHVKKHYTDRTRESNEEIRSWMRMGKVLVLNCDTVV